MTRLTIRHETRYAYERPVGFGPHRLLVRPRDSHALRVIEASLTVSPRGSTRWNYDALGNCVCWFAPQGVSNTLSITSNLVIERFPAPLGDPPVRNPHTASPIVYSHDDRVILSPFMEPATEDTSGNLLAWLRGQMGRPDELALDFLLRLNTTIHDQFVYRARFEEGVQDPAHTVALGSGTCRDFAWLMVETLRRLGYAARFVTGYLYSPALAAPATEIRGAGATHAWCEVFLPELGWIEFDPTNALAESPDLIPIAVSRTPAEAAPVRGSIFGDSGFTSLNVHVDVRPLGSLTAAA